MPESKASNAEPRQQAGVPGRWTAPTIEQVYADEAAIAYINDRVYLTFGQIQVPSALTSLEEIQIKPVARVVLSEQAFRKVLAMFNRVAPDLTG